MPTVEVSGSISVLVRRHGSDYLATLSNWSSIESASPEPGVFRLQLVQTLHSPVMTGRMKGAFRFLLTSLSGGKRQIETSCQDLSMKRRVTPEAVQGMVHRHFSGMSVFQTSLPAVSSAGCAPTSTCSTSVGGRKPSGSS